MKNRTFTLLVSILFTSKANAIDSKYAPVSVTEIKTYKGMSLTCRVIYSESAEPKLLIVEQIENDKENTPKTLLKSWNVQQLVGGDQVNLKGTRYISNIEWLSDGHLKFKNDTIRGSIITSKECEVIIAYEKPMSDKTPTVVCH